MIKAITIYSLNIPFRFSYGHSKKQHRAVSTIIVTAEDVDGNVGIGEAVPREYVTGETPESVFHEVAKLASHFIGDAFNSKTEIDDKILNLAQGYNEFFPSCAFCCLDIALHDLLAQKQKVSMARYLGCEPKPIKYTASIGLKNKPKLIALLLLYRSLGFTSLKLKVGDEHDEDRLKVIHGVMGKNIKVHADANGAWNLEQAKNSIDLLLKYNVWAVEEPLTIPMGNKSLSGQHNRELALSTQHFENYARLRTSIGMPIILDESCISARSINEAIQYNAVDYINMRLSKLGGYSITQNIIGKIPHDIKYGFGAMVGETAILASAGYFLGCAYPDNLFVQGFSHKLLHKKNIAVENVVLKRAFVRLLDSSKYGLGLQLNVDAITNFQQKKHVVVNHD